jgi:hypothetical protein
MANESEKLSKLEQPYPQDTLAYTDTGWRSWVGFFFAPNRSTTSEQTFIMGISRRLFIECIAVLSFFFGLWVYLTMHAGGPITWDEFWYIEASLNSTAYPEVLNRYFHIYLQKLFFALAGHPVLGVKVFWSFEIALVTVLIYTSVRLLSDGAGYWGAYTAVLFFFCQTLIFNFAGVPYADFTAMLMIALGVVLFLFNQTQKVRRSFLILLGLTFFCAVKSKETGVCLIPVLWGSLWEGNARNGWSRAAQNAGSLAIGIAIGICGFMFLDHVFLGDALWAWRLSNLRRLMSMNIGPWDRLGENWYDLLLTGIDIAPPVLLYLLSFESAENRQDKSIIKYLWLIPLVAVVFLTDTLIRGRWGVVPRYFVPAIPVVCILAGHTINVRGNSHDGAIKSLLLLAVAAAAVTPVILWTEKSLAPVGWQHYTFYKAIAYPLGLSLLLYLLVWVRRWNLIKRFLVSLCLVLVISYPLTISENTIRLRVTAEQSARRYYPYAAFAREMVFSPDMKIFISKNLNTKYGMLDMGNSICRGLFNWFFKQAANDAQFVVADPQKVFSDDSYTYIFLTMEDWVTLQEEVQSSPFGKEIKNDKYVTEVDQERKIMFIGKKLDRGQP